MNMHNNVRNYSTSKMTVTNKHKNVLSIASQLFPSFFGGEVGEGKRDWSALRGARGKSTKE